MNPVPRGGRYDACNGDASFFKKKAPLRHFVHMRDEVGSDGH